MSLAYAQDTTPRPFALHLVAPNPSNSPQPGIADDAWRNRTAYTQVLSFDAERIIAREDQRRIIEALRKYAETMLSLIFRGRMVHYAVNLRKIHMPDRGQYLANLRQDISDALQVETQMVSFNARREITPELQKEITAALSWSGHVVPTISFKGGVVRYAVNLSAIDAKYHETVLMAIKGDIAIACQIGTWK